MQRRSTEYKHFHRIMCDSSSRFGSKAYMVSIEKQKSITFSSINAYANKVANFLREKRIGKSDRISLIGKNSIESIIIFFGVLKYGAILNPINFEESKQNIFAIIERVKPKIVIHDQEMDFSTMNAPALCLPFTDYEVKNRKMQDFFSTIENYSSVFQRPLGSKNDIAEILFTSGSTQKPKGVAISREGLFYMTEDIIDKLGITEEQRILENRAFSWASTQLLSILSTVKTGSTLFLAEKFSRSKFPTWLEEHGITISSGVPTVINILVNSPVKLHKNDVPKLQYITSSSAPLPIKKHREFERLYGIPINQMAGMTEAGWMMGNPPKKRKEGSVGTPFKHKNISVVDTNGKQCNIGEVGEIMVRGKSMGKGYLNKDGEIDIFPNSGFLTGDLGYIDSEGYIFLTGRRKDLIIRGGINISPVEITDRILDHPCIEEAVTFGIPDEIYGEEIACFVVPKPNCNVKVSDIMTQCKNTLPPFKLPKILKLVKEIPRTQRRKIIRQALLKGTQEYEL